MRRFKLLATTVAMTVLSSPGWPAIAPYDIAPVDWKAAIAAHKSLSGDSLQALRGAKSVAAAMTKQKTSPDLSADDNRDLTTINAVTSLIRPEVSFAGSPVLLPFDFAAFGKAILSPTGAAPTAAYFGRLKSRAFYPGPYGYRAYLQFKETTSTVMISGSTILFRLPGSNKLETPNSCASMIAEARKPDGSNAKFFEYLAKYEDQMGQVQAEYFDEREATIPCLFAGALIEINILCDAFGNPDCSVKDLVREVFAALTFVGGAPRAKANAGTNDPIQRLAGEIENLSKAAAATKSKKLDQYNPPGELVANSGVGGGSKGSADPGVYGPILFPTDLTASAQTVVFRADEHCLDEKDDKGATCEPASKPVITKAPVGEWRDNFCENRDANNLPTCPGPGYKGHAGQDIWGKGWNEAEPATYPLRAVVDGVAFRRFPNRPAVTVSDINGTNIDYIYRHMRPSDLTAHGILPAIPREVVRGCRLAYADKLLRVAKNQTNPKDPKDKFVDGTVRYEPTARHLHFEIRVPTMAGFQNVSPYKTVVEAHKAAITGVDSSKASTASCKSPS